MLWAITLALSGCDLPRDQGGAMERIRGGRLRTGVAHNPPWTQTHGAIVERCQPPDGREAAIVVAFAREFEAKVEWICGGEADLLERLAERQLDIVIGGLRVSSPWKDRIALSRPHDADRVIAAAPGENELLRRLDAFIVARRQLAGTKS